MPDREDAIRLRHMLDAVHKAIAFVQGRKRADLENDEKLMLALVRLLEIIGEAARGVSSDVRERYPQIAWKDIIGTRDRLIHGYFDVDLDIVWQIVRVDLPKLEDELVKIVSPER